MQYILEFYKKRELFEPDHLSILMQFRRDINFALIGDPKNPEKSFKYLYFNENTTVEFTFIYQPEKRETPKSKPGKGATPFLKKFFDECFHTGYSLIVDLYCPDFYYLEIFFFVDLLQSKHSFIAIDPQQTQENKLPILLDENDLLENLQVGRHKHPVDKEQAYQVSRKKLETWWYYQFHRQKLEEKFSPEIVIPPYDFYIKKQGGQILSSTDFLGYAHPFILPKTDMVNISIQSSRLLGILTGYNDFFVDSKKLLEILGQPEKEMDFPCLIRIFSKPQKPVTDKIEISTLQANDAFELIHVKDLSARD
ncbi:hypothetical protein ACFL35_07590 [Candidatus Riflebacteria bacterium]